MIGWGEELGKQSGKNMIERVKRKNEPMLKTR